MDCPCKECPNKGCGAYHSQCEKYLEWKEIIGEESKRIRMMKESQYRNLKGSK